jgi:hypothetical protein
MICHIITGQFQKLRILNISVSYIDYAIRKVQKNRAGLKLNGTHQLLAYADDVNLLGDNIDTIKHTNPN